MNQNGRIINSLGNKNQNKIKIDLMPGPGTYELKRKVI